MLRGLAGLALSLVLHAAGALIVFLLWPDAPPVPAQALTPTEMRMGVMQVETQRASATAPDAPPAEAATPSASRSAGQGVPMRRSSPVEGAAPRAEAVTGTGASVSPVREAADMASALSSPSERRAAVPVSPNDAFSVGLEAARARPVPPRPEPRPAQVLASVAVSAGVMRAEAMASEQISARGQAPSASAPPVPAPRVAPPAKAGISRPLASVAVSPGAMRAGAGMSLPVVAGAEAPSARAPSAVAPSVAFRVSTAAASRLAPVAAARGTARAEVALSMSPPVASLARTPPVPAAAPAASPRASALRPDAARPAPAFAATAVGAAVSTLRIDAPGVVASAPAARRVTAALDWSGAGALRLDAGGLATLRAFLTPEAAQGRAVRDGMAAALEAPDCARLRTVFDPETGALALRGHVPEAAAAAPLIAALRDEIGDTLPVRNELRVLPDPQCSLLDGLERLGLPQSEEQLTNPNIVGETAFVREYDFTEGDWFVVELGTPDYPAYLYVDYFDSTGQVLHLTPNASLPLQFHPPASPVVIGRDDALRLRIAPPFGQDIVVAFAASRPLYDGLRPTAEPAGPYLDWMRGRVAAERAADPSFKGEWVYLFVASRAGAE